MIAKLCSIPKFPVFKREEDRCPLYPAAAAAAWTRTAEDRSRIGSVRKNGSVRGSVNGNVRGVWIVTDRITSTAALGSTPIPSIPITDRIIRELNSQVI
jgi:hypothetical protein